MCPSCDQPVDKCTCDDAEHKPIGDLEVRVERRTQGRKGQGVTVITGLPLKEEQLKKVARNLKTTFGIGGAVKDGTIELQGDCRDRTVKELKKLGYDAKRAGG